MIATLLLIYKLFQVIIKTHVLIGKRNP